MSHSSSVFHHVVCPWVRHTPAQCLKIFDLNQDGLDDILICNSSTLALIFLQDSNRGWDRLNFPSGWDRDWSNARIADMSGDGIRDLIVVGRLPGSSTNVYLISRLMPRTIGCEQ